MHIIKPSIHLRPIIHEKNLLIRMLMSKAPMRVRVTLMCLSWWKRSNLSAALAPLILGAVGVTAPIGSEASDLAVTVHDLSSNPLMDAAVYAEPVKGSASAGPSAHAMIDQVDREFVPLVSVIRTGTEVSFPNSDNMRHSIYSFSPAKTFNIKLYYGRQASPVMFDKPGIVTLGCNIHDNMMAWVVVVDTPYFGKTTADGVSVLKGLEPGDYHVSVWYPGAPKIPTVSEVHVEANHDARLAVRIDASASPLPALRARAATPKG